MNKKIKLLATGLACAATASLFLASISAPLQVETQVLEPVTATVTFTEQGACVYEKSWQVSALLDGEVEEILVKEGQKVSQGDPIAVLSATDADYQIQRLESSIKGYNAQIYNLSLEEQKERQNLEGTKSDLLGQKVTLESQIKSQETAEETRLSKISLQEDIVAQERSGVRLARQNLREYRDDYDPDTSDPDYVALKLALNEAEKSLAASEQTLIDLQNSTISPGYYEGMQESLDAQISSIDSQMDVSYSAAMRSYYYSQIESAKVSIAELSEKQGKATITAPCNGVISSLPVKLIGAVSQGAVIATVGCTPTVEVFVPVREIDGIHVGDAVSLTVSKRTGDAVYSGAVSEIGSQAELLLSPLGVEESKIRVLISSSSKDVGVGYQVDVDFTVYTRENCLTAPKKALFQQDGVDLVWVVREGLAQIQPVTKGVELRGGWVIEEGLQDGDVIVSDANNSSLAEGKKIAYGV